LRIVKPLLPVLTVLAFIIGSTSSCVEQPKTVDVKVSARALIENWYPPDEKTSARITFQFYKGVYPEGSTGWVSHEPLFVLYRNTPPGKFEEITEAAAVNINLKEEDEGITVVALSGGSNENEPNAKEEWVTIQDAVSLHFEDIPKGTESYKWETILNLQAVNPVTGEPPIPAIRPSDNVIEVYPPQSQSPSPSSTTPVTTPSLVVSRWDLTGNWIFRVEVTGGNIYNHDYTITQSGGALSGTGGVPAGSNRYENTETIAGTNGLTATGPITINSTYGNGSYRYNLTGTIDKDGKISGTWIDNYDPVHKGTFYSISGAAKPIP
jgi:hypothetical protein